jgi:LmbE family N-acetylglucosaminyl deacetylase
MKNILSFFFLLLLSVEYLVAQNPETFSASEILFRMKKLDVLGAVLYIAAHPDDENTRLLAWLSQDKLYQTGYLSLTRGDGGQNLIGDEQGIELGLIRTQELLAARRVDGAEQFFARAYDFGFSKTTAEALKLWDEQKMLSDVVWVIRKFQPDIVITRFPEDKRAGHGQHSASSVLAREAFSAAADPKQFPEQFNYGVQPWQASRLFWNTYKFGSFNTTSEDQLKIEVGGFNSLLGKSYGEVAADSRSQHKSQGFGAPHTRGSQLEYFSWTQGSHADSSLMQNIDCSWKRITGGAAIGRQIDELIKNYNPNAPYTSLPLLVKIYQNIQKLKQGYWRDKKMKETVELIHACSGLWLEATVPGAYASRNQTIPVTLHAVNRAPVEITVTSISLNKQDTSWNLLLQPETNYSLTRNVSLQGLSISQPYWLVEPMFPGSYNVQDQQLIGQAQNAPSLEAIFEIRLYGESFMLREPVLYKVTDPVKGELYEPLTIVPVHMAFCDPDLLVFSNNKSKELVVKRQLKTDINEVDTKSDVHSVNNNIENKSTSISLTTVPGFETLSGSVAEQINSFSLQPVFAKDQRSATWATQMNKGIADTLLQCRTIAYDHIPRIDYFKPSFATIVSVNLQIRGTRIGYIDGAGDKVPDALTAMGFTVIRLNENTVTPEGLQSLDAVITGVRAYDVHEWMAGKYRIFMDYVKNGGNLIVQYNRNTVKDSAGIGPYPFGISSNRVTEEDASVHFLQPDNPVLHFPNIITEKDFDGWVQERGIYFATRMDPRYQAILSMHDTGEPEQNGSLIVGQYGRGCFTYTGLVFFRELPAGVPGAYRLLANLIALNQQKVK